MTEIHSSVALPKPDLSRLVAIEPREVARAFVASQKGGRCDQSVAVAALAKVVDAEAALSDARHHGLIDGHSGQIELKRHANGASAPAETGGGWGKALLTLAFKTVGVDSLEPVSTERGKAPDLIAAALRRLYDLQGLSEQPTRGEMRCALLQQIVASLWPPLSGLAARQSAPFSFDPISRAIYLAFAGLKSGNVLQADAALLRSALGIQSARLPEVAAALVRHAAKPIQPEQAAVAQEEAEVFELERFAKLIQQLARGLETKPYAGRVAIAQVYDAGVARGLKLGSLDEFKDHIAEAAREGLLDLERYDIAGPFDPNLKERSRLRLGRDERHFIVNQWI